MEEETSTLTKGETMSRNFETEMKYLFPTEEALARFMEDARALLFVAGLKAGNLSGPFNRNHTYYDTENLDLLHAGRCFRVGAGAEGFARLTFKEKTKDPRIRVEISNDQDIKTLPDALSGHLRSRAVKALRKVIGKKEITSKLRVYKILNVIMIGACEVSFGYVVFSGPGGAVQMLDLEIEEKPGSEAGVSETVGKILAPRYGLAMDMRSKYEMGMALVGGV